MESALSDPTSYVVSGDEQVTWSNKFQTSRTGLVLPALRDGMPLVFPVLRRDSGETDLERYNRCWNMLKYFQYSCSVTKFSNRFSRDKISKSIIVHLSHTPSWMRPANSFPMVVNSTHKELEKLPPRTIKLIWKKRTKYDGKEEFDEHMAKDDPPLPDFTQISEADPRVMDAMQFADAVRRQYNCQELNFQLQSLLIAIEPQDENVDSQLFNCFTADWSTVQESIRSTSDTDKIEAHLTLRLLDVENNETLFQSTKPPPALDQFFATPNNEAAVVTAPAGVSDEHKQFYQAVFDRTKRADYTIDPRKHFPKPSDDDAYLAHYDGYDVRKPEELLRWQEDTCKAVCGNVPHPKAVKRASTLGGLNLTAEEQTLLDKARQEGEFAAMIQAVRSSNHLPEVLLY